MTTAKPKILTVDDKPENLFALEKLLKELEADVFQAPSGFEALNLALAHDFCVAIVDIQMPGLDGYEFVELLRSNKGTATLPIIFISAIFSDEYHHRKGYEAGAVDFMSKPFIPEILLSKVKVFINLYQQRQALEEEIKQRRQAQAALYEANVTLSKLNADKDKLFSIISHDLRSPFNGILGLTQLLFQMIDKLSQSEIEEMAHNIYSGAKSAFNLLDNLLIWAQLQRKEGIRCAPEPLELRELADETLAVLQQIALEKQIGLNNSVPSGFWVQADRRMLETVIRNLAGNALKFTPRGGQITVQGCGQPGLAHISVVDTGVGMDQADAAKLFKAGIYHSTAGTEQENGTGLGLIICKEMVEQNGGTIWVESHLGQGTKVEFTVPISTSPSVSA